MYMRRHFPGIYAGNEAARMMFRANHIYLLLAAVANLGIGAYVVAHPRGWRRFVQIAASGLVVLGTTLLAAAFFWEPVTASFARVWTFRGVVLLLAGTVGHLASVLVESGPKH